VLDMARFDQFTSGWIWTAEYGSPADPAQLRSLLAWSPLHNVREATRYPAALITTGDRDGLVAPSHSYKFAAALQSAQSADQPILLRVDRGTGHTGATTRARMELAVDRLTFLGLTLGLFR
jgi:prolyl oligopeptidase